MTAQFNKQNTENRSTGHSYIPQKFQITEQYVKTFKHTKGIQITNCRKVHRM